MFVFCVCVIGALEALVAWDLVMLATAWLIGFFRANKDDGIIVVGWFSVHQALRAGCGFTARHADGA